jgi:hypothetical protein
VGYGNPTRNNRNFDIDCLRRRHKSRTKDAQL